jgi:PAS domain S-box-containing protein
MTVVLADADSDHTIDQFTTGHLRATLEAAGIGTWEWNILTGTISWSDNLDEVHGLAPGTFTGTFESFVDLIFPPDRQHVSSAINHTLETGSDYRVEFRVLPPDGKVRWVLGQGRVFRNAAGQPYRMVGLGMDITQRKQAEHRQRLLVEASRTLATSLDPTATLTDLAWLLVPDLADWCFIDIFNDQHQLVRLAAAHADPAHSTLARHLRRYTSSRWVEIPATHDLLLAGKPILVPDITPEMLAAAAHDSEHLAHLQAYGSRCAVIVPLIGRGRLLGLLNFSMNESGRRYHQEDLPTFAELAQQTALILDNARLYRAEQQARLAAEAVQQRLAFLAEASRILAASLDYETTLNNLAHLVVPALADWCFIDIFDEDGQVNRVAAAHADPLQAHLAEALRRYPSRPTSESPSAMALRGNSPVLVAEVTPELLNIIAYNPEHLDLLKRIKACSGIVAPLIAHHRTLGLLVILSTIPERCYTPSDLATFEELARRAASAVDNAKLFRQSQHAVQSRDEFLSIASHELRTPITSLQGYAELMLRRADRDGSLAPRDKHAIRIIYEQSLQLRKLINLLLDVSRLRSGHLVLERETVNLPALLRRLAELIGPTLEPPLTLQVQLPEEPILVDGDPVRIEQVFQNLLNNAIKYSPNGGTITLTLDCHDTQARVTLADQGIGIPAGAIPHLFDRFYRANNALLWQAGGLGIGLYVVKEIVALHNGTITVISQEGQGSTFTITLPLYAP